MTVRIHSSMPSVATTLGSRSAAGGQGLTPPGLSHLRRRSNSTNGKLSSSTKMDGSGTLDASLPG